MTISDNREALHRLIDKLPESQLLEAAKFVEFLLSKETQSVSDFDLWDVETDVGPDKSAADDRNALSDLIRSIKKTPPNAQAITLPTKTWTDYAAEATPDVDVSLDVAAWNRTWDTLEAEMEADSLAHEELERQEQEQ